MTAPVTDETVTEATATETPTPSEDSVETEKATVDLTSFEAAVEALLGAPEGTDPADLVFAVRREYHEHDRNGKTAARKFVEDRQITAIMNSDVAGAQTLIRLKDEMIKPMPVSGAPRAPKPPKNSTEDVVAQIASIRLAYSLAMLRANSNELLDAGWNEQVDELATSESQDRSAAYAAWLEAKQEGEEPQANEVEKAAARISLGRAPKGQGRKPKNVEDAAKAAAEASDADGQDDAVQAGE